jgi:thiamine biosynthesis lipoprotein
LRYSTLSVIAPTATEADALSTALSLMPLSQIQSVVASRTNVQARIMTLDGTLNVCGA